MKFGFAGTIFLGILVPLCIIMKMLYHNDLIDPFKSVTVVTNGLGIFKKNLFRQSTFLFHFGKPF